MENNTLTLTKQQQTALSELGVVLCYQHGSTANGQPRKQSDVDIAVLFSRTPESCNDSIDSVTRIVQELVPDKYIDVLILNTASPLAVQRVASLGHVLYQRTEDDRILFELKALRRYEDTKHFLEIGRSAMIDKALV